MWVSDWYLVPDELHANVCNVCLVQTWGSLSLYFLQVRAHFTVIAPSPCPSLSELCAPGEDCLVHTTPLPFTGTKPSDWCVRQWQKTVPSDYRATISLGYETYNANTLDLRHAKFCILFFYILSVSSIFHLFKRNLRSLFGNNSEIIPSDIVLFLRQLRRTFICIYFFVLLDQLCIIQSFFWFVAPRNKEWVKLGLLWSQREVCAWDNHISDIPQYLKS